MTPKKGALNGFIVGGGDIIDNFFGYVSGFGGCLFRDRVEGECIWVLNCDLVTSAWSIKFLDFDAKLFCCGIVILACFPLETTATELGLFADVDALICSVSTDGDPVIVFRDDIHAQVEENPFDLGWNGRISTDTYQNSKNQ